MVDAKKRKVFILCNKLTGGGVEKVLQEIANYLAAKSDLYSVTVTTLEGPDEGRSLFLDSIKIKGVFRSSAAYKKWSVAWFWFKFRQLLYCIYILLGKYDIVLTIKDGWYIKLGAHMRANRKIAWMHTGVNSAWASSYFKSPNEERECLSAFDRVICVSEYKRQLILDYLGDPGNLIVCYNPLNVLDIVERSQEAVHLPANVCRPVFVSVGRLSYDKKNSRLLECAKMLKEKHEFSLWIVGDGKERENLENYIKENELTNVELFGWLDNPYPIINAADWFVSASTSETYGLTLQEANILGKPALVATLPVFEECADPSKVILVENSVEGLLDGMIEILEGRCSINIDSDINALHKKFFFDRIEKIEQLILQ